MLFLAYDTETTGLAIEPQSTNFYDTMNWPRIYQLGAILFDEMGFEYGRLNSLVRPHKWKIPSTDPMLKELGQENWHEQRGITTEYLMDNGRSMPDVINDFIELAHQADARVCHNAGFDRPVLICEFFRYNAFPRHWETKEQFCTKLMSEPILKIPGYHPGTYKWPTLQEAYKHFYGVEFDGAHDAMADVQATVDIFLKMFDVDNDDWM